MTRYFFVFLTATLMLGTVSASANDGVILGKRDDRVPVSEPGVARINKNCTAWQISNGALLTAGHCFNKENSPPGPCTITDKRYYAEYNVPLSHADGRPTHSSPSDSFDIDRDSIECQVTDDFDWAIFSVEPTAGELPAYKYEKFFRPALVSLRAQETQLKIAGYGIDGPAPKFGANPYPRNKYSQTEQADSGPYVQTTGYIMSYVVDTMPGGSGSPVFINGSSIAVAIHRGRKRDSEANEGTVIWTPSLALAMHKFPGTLFSPVIAGKHIFYVDAGAPRRASPSTGKYLSPYKTVKAGFNAAGASTDKTLLTVVAGQYGGYYEDTTIADISVSMKEDISLLMPVGDVVVWKH